MPRPQAGERPRLTAAEREKFWEETRELRRRAEAQAREYSRQAFERMRPTDAERIQGRFDHGKGSHRLDDHAVRPHGRHRFDAGEDVELVEVFQVLVEVLLQAGFSHPGDQLR